MNVMVVVVVMMAVNGWVLINTSQNALLIYAFGCERGVNRGGGSTSWAGVMDLHPVIRSFGRVLLVDDVPGVPAAEAVPMQFQTHRAGWSGLDQAFRASRVI